MHDLRAYQPATATEEQEGDEADGRSSTLEAAELDNLQPGTLTYAMLHPTETDLRFAFLTPEALSSRRPDGGLTKAAARYRAILAREPPGLIVIEEAHTLVAWDFRPRIWYALGRY